MLSIEELCAKELAECRQEWRKRFEELDAELEIRRRELLAMHGEEPENDDPGPGPTTTPNVKIVSETRNAV